MDQERLARLTEQQRVCLRLVYTHMTSKEIARLLGLEPGSVDQHIKTAMRILGVSERRVAARLLAEYEEEDAPSAAAGSRMQDAQMAFQVTPPRLEPLLPLPWEGLRPTNVGWKRRLAWIAALTIGCTIALAMLITAAAMVSALLRR
jgi:DNA-binding CsgD family transcriptional regulator